MTLPNKGSLGDSEPTLDHNLKWNYHPNNYMEHEKNETWVDNANETMIR